MSRTIAYRISPIMEQAPGSLSTAALMTCVATGEVLSGSGGGGDFLAPAIVDALRAKGPKVVLDAADYEALMSVVRTAAEGFDVSKEAEAVLSGLKSGTV